LDKVLVNVLGKRP